MGDIPVTDWIFVPAGAFTREKFVACTVAKLTNSSSIKSIVRVRPSRLYSSRAMSGVRADSGSSTKAVIIRGRQV